MTGSKLGKDYIKTVYCHLDYLTYMQSTSCEMSGWIKHKLESGLLEKYKKSQVCRWYHPYGRKPRTKEPLDESERGELQNWLKTQNNKPGLVWDHLFQSCRPSDASATRSRPLATGPSSQSHQQKTTDSGTTEGMSPCSGSFFSSSITISEGYHAENRYTEMSRIPLVVLERLSQIVVES